MASGSALLAEPLRIATYAAPLSRDGPGLLLRDILKAEDNQLASIVQIIRKVSPDILLLTDFDYDLDGLALSAFADALDAGYTTQFAWPPNTGMATGLDLDADGYLGDARDAMGYGRFAGDGGMALLSRLPVLADEARDLSDVLWRDVPDATLPTHPDAASVYGVLRLSHSGHWMVPVALPDGGQITLLAFSASPPVFDGPEDRNGLRNRDELMLWSHVLDSVYGPAPEQFVVLGNSNLDPVDGDGYADAMAAFLSDPRLQDPAPRSDGGALAADAPHGGDPATDTADWPDTGPGNLRVSYVLPSANLTVTGAGVFWPAPDTADADLLGSDGLATGAHRLVWVDIAR
ncbi:endonuclease/exonuclease/phosphatase family protein [Yoonia sp. 208BN28-4]|uniref:endonuclease/exonuclease/phosphatase family protein n=1 Tax=Yoonia sp. 208BN28-4 TaxID=3126505 RepID=UPI0030AA9B05